MVKLQEQGEKISQRENSSMKKYKKNNNQWRMLNKRSHTHKKEKKSKGRKINYSYSRPYIIFFNALTYV